MTFKDKVWMVNCVGPLRTLKLVQENSLSFLCKLLKKRKTNIFRKELPIMMLMIEFELFHLSISTCVIFLNEEKEE